MGSQFFFKIMEEFVLMSFIAGVGIIGVYYEIKKIFEII